VKWFGGKFKNICLLLIKFGGGRRPNAITHYTCGSWDCATIFCGYFESNLRKILCYNNKLYHLSSTGIHKEMGGWVWTIPGSTTRIMSYGVRSATSAKFYHCISQLMVFALLFTLSDGGEFSDVMTYRTNAKSGFSNGGKKLWIASLNGSCEAWIHTTLILLALTHATSISR
jgi:hypothetical protein